MSFYNILTGDITDTVPASSSGNIGTTGFANVNIQNNVRIEVGARDLAGWLSELSYLGQVLSVESYATKGAVKEFNKISNSASQLAAKLGVKNVLIAAVYNPFGITNGKEWTTKFNGIIGRQRQVFTDANVNNQAGILREELVLAGKWTSWSKTFPVQLNAPKAVVVIPPSIRRLSLLRR